MANPEVSVIVPTKNSAATLEACLESIRSQTFKSLELIVIDNFSSDDTREIAARLADRVFTRGPERSAQRNFGAKMSSGDYLLMIDSDMELDQNVIQACVDSSRSNPSVVGLAIPEESFGIGFWAQCKRLERSFYIGVTWLEAARFFCREAYDAVGGYEEELISGEDWDLSRRLGRIGAISRIDYYIYHNEGHVSLASAIRKKYYYAKFAKAYLSRNPEISKIGAQVGPLRRYALFFSKPGKLFGRPVVGLAMLFMKGCEFTSGAIGYMLSRQNRWSF